MSSNPVRGDTIGTREFLDSERIELSTFIVIHLSTLSYILFYIVGIRSSLRVGIIIEERFSFI